MLRKGFQNQNKTRINKLKKGQSILEYSVVIAVIVAALLSMKSYLKRSLQGNYRASADVIGGAYDPRNTTSDTTIATDGLSITTSVTNEVGGKLITTTDFDSEDISSQNGWEQVGPLP